jgi:hypothetical protein
MVSIERRRFPPYAQGEYSLGITRLESLAQKAIDEHDHSFSDLDDEEWQVKYSLKNHIARVAMVAKKMAQARHRSTVQIEVCRIAGLFHDIGKIDDECKLYRVNRSLLPDEKLLVDKHADYSGKWLLRMVPYVRREDYAFLLEAYLLVIGHHQPYMIQVSHLREMAYDLMFADIFVSIQEDRNRPGLDLWKAVDFVERLDPAAKDSGHWPHQKLIELSKRTISWLYGNNMEEANPFGSPD